MVDEHVTLTDDIERRLRCVAQLGWCRRHKRWIAQLGDVHRRDPHQIAEVEESAGLDHVGFGERRHLLRLLFLQLTENQLTKLHRRTLLQLDAHYLGESPLEDLLLDRAEQVVIVIEHRQLEVRVPDDAKGAEAAQLHPREERPQIGADQLLQRNEVVLFTKRHPARKALWHFDAGEARILRQRVVDLDRKGQRQIGDVRGRIGRVEGERCQQRVNLRLEKLIEALPLCW